MARTGWRRLARELPGAVMLGVGALFQGKVRPEDHWSASPRVQIVHEVADAGSGAPPPPDR